MQFLTYSAFFASMSALSAFAAPASSPAAAIVPKQSCWTGGIHSACNGATTGCTTDGILWSLVMPLRRGVQCVLLSARKLTNSPAMCNDKVVSMEQKARLIFGGKSCDYSCA
ncbi:hypothetical protein BKA67DRAFT_537597 [Truncatella angustata]|uniref:Uncharacterized protein n=1 Tax=Truncatella angustata TaxID=152316 RepID=A0A9P8UGM1_9PEZI|nr:uncharacterized protein BKA67DRAFT_537597 [Truncatella angustata]KAH6651739.1 hypothetical protein BKA67DRAFT_537597 [Truncatella angustata]